MKEKIKSLLKEPVEDSIIEFSILEVEDYIKNYCNRDEIPKELDITIIKIAIDLINYDSSENDIKSLNQGDTSITFNIKYKTREDVFINYNKILSRFRKVKK